MTTRAADEIRQRILTMNLDGDQDDMEKKLLAEKLK